MIMPSWSARPRIPRRFAGLALLACLAATAGAADLRVMSFNLRYGTAPDREHAWPGRRDAVVATITGFAPDLLGTQECLAFQRDELLAALPGYAVVAAGRDDGAEAGEMCAAFYRRDRFALRDHGTFWLSPTPAVVASRGWDAALPRIATWLRLEDRASGRELLWLDTHFDHQGDQARRQSAAQLHAWLRDHRGQAQLVVTGDFNAPADQGPGGPYTDLLGDSEPALLRDTFAIAHPADTAGTFHGFTGRAERGRIDWILASPELAVLEAAVVSAAPGGVWPSDHFPVTAVLAAGSGSALQRVAAFNLAVADVFAASVVDSLLAAERDLPVATRVSRWAWRLAAAGGTTYRFGLAAGGYADAGRLLPGREYDCISLIYRVSELARARDGREALAIALATRFAGAPADSVVDAEGRVRYDHPSHLDYSVDMIRSGHWGDDVTDRLAGARPDPQGTARYAAGTVAVVPADSLRTDELRDGDLVWFVLSASDPPAAALRRDHGLWVGHAGVVVVRDGMVWLVHAASRPLPGWYDAPGVVRVPLAVYLARVERYDGLMVTRF
ncbi:MAG: endonuclease/exonuclease/phosphatase family protein [Candidatus Krumholzibacteriia bacterium]